MAGTQLHFVTAFACLLSCFATDPQCLKGLANHTPASDGDACCAKSCGRCGGVGCSSLPGGAASCCSGKIINAKISCNDADPPCLVHRQGPPTCTLQPGVEMLGNDIATPKLVAGESDCCAACSSNSKCKFFTYEGGKNGLCHLKNEDGPDTSRQNASCTSGFVGSSPPSPPPPADVNVDVSSKRHTTGPNFLCWNMDASRNRGFFWRNVSARDSHSYGAQLARQAAEIGKRQAAGYSLLRFGGSGNDYLTYATGGTPCPPQSDIKECMNETAIRDFMSFAEKANARIIWGLSLNTGHDLATPAVGDGGFPFPWDPTNAKQLLKFIIAEGFAHLIVGLELGNEQNSKYSAAKDAQNFEVLHNLTLELWPNDATRPKLYGPDRHSFHNDKIDSYIADFVTECKKRGVPLYGATHHEYTEVDGTSFTSSDHLDVNAQIAKAVNKSIRSRSSSVKVVGGEIGPHNGGSPPCDHTSMRWANFGDSLWYVDALASKARYGYETFCRQDYIGADYGLVDCSTGTPLPDYYTALVWTQTMGAVVLNAEPAPTSKSAIRVYAHCTSGTEPSSPKKGSVTLAVVNIGESKTVLHVPAHLGSITQKYVLSASDDPAHSLIKSTGLLGTAVLLNGKVLELNSDGTVPKLSGTSVGTKEATIPKTSIAFLVLGDAGHADCMGTSDDASIIV